jgi:hypothetical protein
MERMPIIPRRVVTGHDVLGGLLHGPVGQEAAGHGPPA